MNVIDKIERFNLRFCTEFLNSCIIFRMDNIMNFKKQHVKITDTQIKNLLQSQIKLIHNVKDKQSQNYTEDEIKIKELTSKITSMKDMLQSEQQSLEHKNYDLSKELDYILELETEKKKFLEENESLEIQRNKLRTCKRNLQDQELLDQGRKKFSLYKELTGIRWDYEKLKENIAGYVTNKKKYIHHFCYSHGNEQDLHNLLWHEIYQCTVHTENKNIHNRENVIHDR